ncbi:MAG: ribonuclease [Miltoncostaeaceae bacterium]|nr:ribonuclease [Miltoncostaeaceae bacterium]
MSAPEPITDAAGAAALAADARAAGRAAIDFEFLWERTYRPQPCLVSVAVDGRVELLDPIEGAPLGPVGEMVADPSVTVIMHAPSADLILLVSALGIRPTAIVDTQLLAGFVGLGSGQSLGSLVERALGVRLAKTESYTDWARRPLSQEQLTYAADDVRYLLQLADELQARVQRLGREQWAADEHARRYGPGARFVPDPDEAWRRVKGHGRLSPTDRAVLRSLAAWREREAARRDRPAAWVVPDRTLLELARRRATSRAGIQGERGLPERLRPAELDGILEAIRTGVEEAPLPLPPPPPPEVRARLEPLVALGQVLVGARAAAAEIAPVLVASRDDIETFLAAALEEGIDGHALAAGWRRELVGDALLELAAGRLALGVGGRRPYLAEVPLGDDLGPRAAPV